MTEPQRSRNLRLEESQSRGHQEAVRGTDGWCPASPLTTALQTLVPHVPWEFSGSQRTSLQGQGISLPLQQSDRHVNRRKVPALHQAPCWVLPLRTHSAQTITLQVGDWYPGEEKMEAGFFVVLPFPTSQRHHVRKYSNWEVYMSYRIQEFYS